MRDWASELSARDPLRTRENRVQFLVDLDELAVAGSFACIDGVLDAADPETLSEITLLTILRGTFRFREKLNRWEALRDKAAEALHARGTQIEMSMMGLL